ncbi:MAG: hypothetical protein QOF71_1707 [Candidatus Eremiobacteraeota bacterium]|jgi:hypothetical protein|nr:hypothetical protein [Candidatus Eremiobacteraeota bacterium]
MLFRSLLRVAAAVAFAALIAPAVPSAAPPPGLAYDEIVRVVVNATPPPPGNFQADLAALTSPQALAASPTPAPKKRGISIGAIAGAIAGGGGAGGVAGAVAGDLVSNAMENAMQQSLGAQFGALAALARGFMQPHLMRYAYLNGWERVEDVTAQTATIRKCDIGQVVRLDLAKKTYAVYDPNAEPTDAPAAAPPAPRRGRSAPPDPQQPGTATATLTSTTKALGPLRIENQPTAGYDSTTSFAITQSTGSCRDGGASIENVEYVAPVGRPAVTSCPVRRRPIPETADAAFAPPPTGGCRPTFTARRSGPTPPANRLALYSLVTFGASAAATPAPAASPGAGTVGFLTERGNLKILGQADTGLFAIPQGYTKVSP